MSSSTSTACSSPTWKESRARGSRSPSSSIARPSVTRHRARMRNLTLPLLFAAALSVPSLGVAQPAVSAAPAPADARLKALYEAYADWDQRESGFTIDAKGERQDAAYLPKVDPTTQLARARFEQAMLDQLSAIPVGSLSPSERVNAGVLRAILEADVADAK